LRGVKKTLIFQGPDPAILPVSTPVPRL